MSTPEVLEELQKRLDVSMYGLGKLLTLKSAAHVWLMKKGIKRPGIDTCMKIINLGKSCGMDITLDMLRGDS